MAPMDLNWVRAFAVVHETGSFSQAGERLAVPRSTVSRAVAALEEALGVLLFHRTTRKVATTQAGLALYERVSPSLSAMEASLADMPEHAEVPSGLLRVTTTLDLGVIVVAGAASRFTARYPEVRVELQLGNALVDLVRDGFDLALRVSLRPLKGASLIALKVGRIRVGLYASPAYLARRGTPRSAAELPAHDWVSLHGYPPVASKAPRALAQHPPRFTCDDMFTAREALRTGGGVGVLPAHLAEQDVAEGALVHVLPQWFQQTASIYAVHPSRRHVPRKVTLFRDLLIEQIRRGPLAIEAHST